MVNMLSRAVILNPDPWEHQQILIMYQSISQHMAWGLLRICVRICDVKKLLTAGLLSKFFLFLQNSEYITVL